MRNSTALWISPILPKEREDELRLAQCETPVVGRFERLPKWLNCIPLIVQWLWLSFRYGSVSLPSAANPYITCGGMVGEGKLEYFECMGSRGKNKTADYVSLIVEDNTTIHAAIKSMQVTHLDFPIVVKPNLGWCGYGVRLVSSSEELERYLNVFPKGETVILQRYVPEAGEAGIFYARHPNDEAGRIVSITLRYFPQVIGDGRHTIQQLVVGNERLRRVENSALHEPAYNPNRVPDKGEQVRLSTIGSTRVGGLYCDGSDHVTPALNEAIDAITHEMRDFYVGRFDVRYESLELLREGKGFTIMEVNGAGSESVHAWDPKYSIAESYGIIFQKQRLLFLIGAANRQKGHKPIGLFALARLHFHQQSLIKRYPLSN